MDPEPTNTADVDEQPAVEEKPPSPRTVANIDRELSGLLASHDQVAAGVGDLFRLMASQAFAFGVLAAIVFLQGRKLKELADALAG